MIYKCEDEDTHNLDALQDNTDERQKIHQRYARYCYLRGATGHWDCNIPHLLEKLFHFQKYLC